MQVINISNAHDARTYSVGKQLTFRELIEKLRSSATVAWFLAQSTLTVVAMALIILSPMLIYPFLLNHPAPLCYFLYAGWIAFFGICIVVAAIVGYLRETIKGE